MKGICHIWSRARHFSSSLPGDRYLKLGSKSDHRVEISGNIVRYDALALRPEVLRSISCFYANCVFWIFPCTSSNLPELIVFNPLQNVQKWQLSPVFPLFWLISNLRHFRPFLSYYSLCKMPKNVQFGHVSNFVSNIRCLYKTFLFKTFPRS